MDGSRNLMSNSLGLCLLPSELIQEILLRLVLPEIIRLRTVCKTLTSVISAEDFRREYNSRSSSDSWLFVYKKRSPRNSLLHGFTDRSDRWFKLQVAEFLFPAVPPGEDLYFLTASGNFFLFASNNRRELISVNLKSNTVKRIPPSPLGPRGTSSWRRSGLKLIAGPPGSDRFQFLFADLYENRPALFVYGSETDTWRSMEAIERETNQPGVTEKGTVFLSVVHRRTESVVIALGPEREKPMVLRPRFDGGGVEERLAVGFGTADASDQLHVYGDGDMVIIRSELVHGRTRKMRMFTCIELWRLSVDGRVWDLVSEVPSGLVNRIKKAYGVMTGCLEERDGIIRVVLVSNCEGLWDLIWLTYDLRMGNWAWVPLPEFRMEGLNMAGIALSSGLSLF